jgi:fructose 1,6-bisphosphate aldolase/phosphatase
MRITLSVIKAHVGSIGGHLCPSRRLLETVRRHVTEQGKDLLIDSYVRYTGDDIAILATHTRGDGDPALHALAWDAFNGRCGGRA